MFQLLEGAFAVDRQRTSVHHDIRIHSTIAYECNIARDIEWGSHGIRVNTRRIRNCVAVQIKCPFFARTAIRPGSGHFFNISVKLQVESVESILISFTHCLIQAAA